MTFYVQNESPGEDKEPDWLPAPKGPFAAALRAHYWWQAGDRKCPVASDDHASKSML